MRYLLFLIALFGISLPASAETLYVNDVLRVNVRDEPGRGATTVGVVVTGMALEALEQDSGYIKVRTPEGVEGWVKDDYLTSDRPARLLLEDKSGETVALADQMTKVNEELAGVREENQQLLRQVNLLEERLAAAAQEAHPAEMPAQASTVAPVDETVEALPRFKFSSDTLLYWIGGILFIVLLGFVSGISWHKKQVSRRLGGLRI